MRVLFSAIAGAALTASLATAGMAQDKPAQAQADQAGSAQSQPAAPPQPASTTDPNLQVATVRLEGGYRASKVVGAAVYNAQNQQIGTVDDIILNHQNQADLVVLAVGGFLGVGAKLVALPYSKIERTDNGKVMLQDASKEELTKMPSFTYSP